MSHYQIMAQVDVSRSVISAVEDGKHTEPEYWRFETARSRQSFALDRELLTRYDSGGFQQGRQPRAYEFHLNLLFSNNDLTSIMTCLVWVWQQHKRLIQVRNTFRMKHLATMIRKRNHQRQRFLALLLMKQSRLLQPKSMRKWRSDMQLGKEVSGVRLSSTDAAGVLSLYV